MIIFKNNYWQSNDQFPDFDYTRYTKVYDNESSSLILKEREDYVESDNPVTYVIPDDSPLTYKVMQYAPNMKVITDEKGTVIDVIEDYSLEDVIKLKIAEVNNSCNNTIYNGIDYNGEHFDLTEEDQINIMSNQKTAELGIPVPYHSSSADKTLPCKIYTPEEFIGLAKAAAEFKVYQLSYCNLLKCQIWEMTDKEEIKAIKYGDSLNDKYQNMLNQLLGGQNETNS